MSKNYIKRFIKKFFSDDESSEGRRLIEFWYHSFDDKANELEGYSSNDRKKLKAEMLHNINSAIDKKKAVESRNRKSRFRTRSKIAAGLVVMLLALGTVVYMQSRLFWNRAPVFKTVQTATEEIKQLTMPDGSRVWLSAASTLRYPKAFDDEKRHVFLQGEAYFDVKENADRPFVIDNLGLKVRVVGTAFNVRGFTGDSLQKVTVSSGLVEVQHQSTSSGSLIQKVNVNPNEQLVFDTANRNSRLREVQAATYQSWRKGALAFDGETFKEIASYLEQWYNVRIIFTDPHLEHIQFKISFQKKTIEEALQRLSIIQDFNFIKEKSTILISSSS